MTKNKEIRAVKKARRAGFRWVRTENKGELLDNRYALVVAQASGGCIRRATGWGISRRAGGAGTGITSN